LLFLDAPAIVPLLWARLEHGEMSTRSTSETRFARASTTAAGPMSRGTFFS
jgi:hypothetical protein